MKNIKEEDFIPLDLLWTENNIASCIHKDALMKLICDYPGFEPFYRIVRESLEKAIDYGDIEVVDGIAVLKNKTK